MKATKEQLVDFIYHNFTKDGKKILKKTLNEYALEDLEKIIKHNHCEERLERWLNQPEMIGFLVDGIKDGRECSWDCEYPSIEACREAFVREGIKVLKLVEKKGNHRCGYCHSIVEGSTDEDLLCKKCMEVFGHHYFSEL